MTDKNWIFFIGSYQNKEIEFIIITNNNFEQLELLLKPDEKFDGTEQVYEDVNGFEPLRKR